MTLPAGSAIDLDDPAALEAADPQGMLRDIASSAAQVREAASMAREAGVERVAGTGRPRAVVVCGMGGSGIAGDVLAAVAGTGAPLPILVHRGYGLPGWVGAADLVIAVSCSGRTEETLSALEEAVRRGCSLLVVGAEGSPLTALGERGRAVVVPVRQGRQPRASVWALSTPLLLAGDALGLLDASPQVVERVAAVLEDVAARCRIDGEELVNPAKQLGMHLRGAVPVVWGTSPLAGVAAYRFACQLNENAKTPATWGVLPEANHNQVVALDGRFAGGGSDDDFFRDRTEDAEGGRLALVLLRDAEEHPQVSRRADASAALAEQRGVPVRVVASQEGTPFERLARLVGTADFASAYLALAEGTDPTPVEAIEELKRAISR
jgi:glucose/mannose-6-phosphate isomerase